jgi:Ni/Co efflux regulator RcnB
MKNRALVIAIAAACLTTGASAMAQSYDYRGDRYERQDRYEHERRYDQPERDYRRRDDDNGYRRDDNYGYRRDDNDGYRRDDNDGYRHHMRGAGPYHDMRRGDRLPMAFWGRQYRVADWHRARLDPPMQGCSWVRVGDDYVQVSVSTGLITAVLLRR